MHIIANSTIANYLRISITLDKRERYRFSLNSDNLL